MSHPDLSSLCFLCIRDSDDADLHHRRQHCVSFVLEGPMMQICIIGANIVSLCIGGPDDADLHSQLLLQCPFWSDMTFIFVETFLAFHVHSELEFSKIWSYDQSTWSNHVQTWLDHVPIWSNHVGHDWSYSWRHDGFETMVTKALSARFCARIF